MRGGLAVLDGLRRHDPARVRPELGGWSIASVAAARSGLHHAGPLSGGGDDGEPDLM